MDDVLLMLPGPTTVHPRVLNAMAQAVVNHRSAKYGEILTETSELMADAFQTKNQAYLLTGSGTAAMEAAISNVLNPGEKVLNVVGGKFGERFMKIAQAHGIDTQELAVEWGTAVTPEAVKEALDADEDIKAITVVHNETSTGVAAPIKEVGKVMKDYDALYIVDTVSSLGGDEVKVDDFGIDVCVTGSQKCLAAPPGMAAITLSDDAWDKVEKVTPNGFYLDMKAYKKSGDKTPPETPYTPSVSLTYAMNEALKMVKEEGLDNRVARHHKAAKASVDAVKALGLELFADEDVSSATVTAVKMPEGITDADFRGTTRDKYGVELAGGQDHLKGNIFRIGHMGNISYKELLQTFGAIGMTLKELGVIDEAGAGVASIADSYSA
ncbi:MAG: alanine--glyoxylate aminotransferase family protein [Methanobrevibacter sp.]|uniref:pyridoxal-phosphate-dependent aminotransferase family protein n=1 Tax=Methanobrevibacter sp. TaxID=66852 RepID=UPI0026DFDC6A|nr:alanine--glyoxylate aminotransferase family protein [Methanobrevibacter sp.]MDO5848498.1 alanine--glyoxylate aminotransferase family protein [Methanobrevibacter sp.]